jgi:hypothetical protein
MRSDPCRPARHHAIVTAAAPLRFPFVAAGCNASPIRPEPQDERWRSNAAPTVVQRGSQDGLPMNVEIPDPPIVEPAAGSHGCPDSAIASNAPPLLGAAGGLERTHRADQGRDS